MNVSPNKTPIEIIKLILVVHILEIFILILIRMVHKFMERIYSFKKY